MRKLRLATDLALPLDAVTQTFLIVGKRGSGKSNTAARFVEQLHHARLPFVVLDPVDTWWGLKAGRKKGEQGLDDVYVFGGRRHDLPLNAGDGALIADVLCEHRVSMVLSVKHLSGRERSTFMVAFAQTLFQKWGGGPLHVVLEEAHELAPQMAGGRGRDPDGESAMLGAFKRLWKLGRASGIGGTAVTQRPASLSKDITTQSEILVAHRVIGPQDVKAVGEWVKYHGERLDILAELPTLPTGQAFIWSPEFPEGKPIGLTRTTVLLRETYDSASTPKVGEIKAEPRELAKVDLDKLRAKMATTIEKAKANDAGELRKQLAAVRVELETLRKSKEPKPGKTVVETRDALTDADRKLLTRLADLLETLQRGQFADDFDKLVERLKASVHQSYDWARGDVLRLLETKKVAGLLQRLTAYTESQTTMTPRREPLTPSKATGGPGEKPTRSARRAPEPVEFDGGPLPPGEVACLTAILQYPGLERKRLGVLTTYKRSTRDVYIAKLVAKGLVDANGNGLQATDAGVKAMTGKYEPLPTGDALVEYWRQRLPEGERRTLDVLLAHPGKDVVRTAIDESTGYARSTRDVYLTKLRARGLVDFVGSGKVRASSELVG